MKSGNRLANQMYGFADSVQIAQLDNEQPAYQSIPFVENEIFKGHTCPKFQEHSTSLPAPKTSSE